MACALCERLSFDGRTRLFRCRMFQSVAAGRSRMGAKRSIVKENKNGRQNSQNAEKRSRKRKNPKAVRQLTAIYVALVLAAAGAIGGGVFWAVHSTRVTEELIAHAVIDDGRGKHSSCCYRRNRRNAGDGTRNRNGDRDGNRNACRADRGQYRRLCKSGIL